MPEQSHHSQAGPDKFSTLAVQQPCAGRDLSVDYLTGALNALLQ